MHKCAILVKMYWDIREIAKLGVGGVGNVLKRLVLKAFILGSKGV